MSIGHFQLQTGQLSISTITLLRIGSFALKWTQTKTAFCRWLIRETIWTHHEMINILQVAIDVCWICCVTHSQYPFVWQLNLFTVNFSAKDTTHKTKTTIFYFNVVIMFINYEPGTCAHPQTLTFIPFHFYISQRRAANKIFKLNNTLQLTWISSAYMVNGYTIYLNEYNGETLDG